jgi:biotin synthase-like enzyme
MYTPKQVNEHAKKVNEVMKVIIIGLTIGMLSIDHVVKVAQAMITLSNQ